jgi:hypothetical protein
MDKKIMGILFLVVLVSFSGIAAASTIGDTGSTIIYTSTSDKANNWYISTLTDQFSSTYTSKVEQQKYISKDWISETTAIQTRNFLKESKSTIRKY